MCNFYGLVVAEVVANVPEVVEEVLFSVVVLSEVSPSRTPVEPVSFVTLPSAVRLLSRLLAAELTPSIIEVISFLMVVISFFISFFALPPQAASTKTKATIREMIKITEDFFMLKLLFGFNVCDYY